MSAQQQSIETHPHLPSGKWEGFYSYHFGPDSSKHKMALELSFEKGKIRGRGNDDVGYFTWKGTYDTKEMTVNLTKYYTSHEVVYQGWVDENGIWGNWNIGLFKGGFHIWPKESFQEKEAKEEELAKAKRKEAYRKNLSGLKKYIGDRWSEGLDDEPLQ